MKLLRRTAGPMHTCVPLSQNGKSHFSVRYSLQKLPKKQTKNIIIYIYIYIIVHLNASDTYTIQGKQG